jgi:hypothetical protein
MAMYINPGGSGIGGGFGANPPTAGGPSPFMPQGGPTAPNRPFPIPPRPVGGGAPQPPNRPFSPLQPPTGQPGGQQPQPIGVGAIRPTGPSSGFDPSYLQNLAVNEGGLFPNQQGLQFNPLGNLTDIGGTMPTGGGNAPVAGLPPTMLQQSLAQNPTFQQGGQQSPQSLAAMLQQTFGGGNGLLNLFGLGNVSGT